MRFEAFPTREELKKHARIIPEIEPSAVLAMLRISQAAEIIRSSITTTSWPSSTTCPRGNCGS